MTVVPAASALLVVVLLSSGCGTAASGQPTRDAAASERLRVATTVAPITNIAANIGGDRVDITGIVPEGTNSHTFEPPPSAAETLSEADVVLVNGLQLEDPTVELAERIAPQAELVEIGTAVLPESDYIYDFSFPEEEGKPNPHLWTDPLYAVKYAEVIRDTFTAQDPDNADYFARNYAAFTKKATELSEAVRVASATLPEERRRLLTYHDAYAYFAKDYEWQVIGAVQPKDFADPTPQEVARIIEQIRTEEVPTIFGSEVFPSPVLAQIGRESGARYEDTLRDDDLPGEPGDPEHSWLGLMRYDFVTMVEGLGGDASALRELTVENVAPDEAAYPQ
ncbi:metal ABC transporter substrate-binding protein [soil metagenome]|jgi:ABC-type Zn uptake system ZnuABC Zn-binding protein ZnuA